MPLPDNRVLEHDSDQANGDPSWQPIGALLPPATRAGLLDPALWQDGLAKYARATNLAVALADTAGRLIGEYINPRPTWSLLHSKTPPNSSRSVGSAGGVEEVGCPFSLVWLQPCNCVADALASGGVVVARDRTGLVHFAVPLVLGGHQLGALVAGQVFTRYPEQLPLEHIDSQFLLSPGKVWELARLEHPVKQTTLEVYADLLATLGQTFLQTRYHSLREAELLAEMTRLRDHAMAMVVENANLYHTLQEADLRKDEFLAMLAHELRGPLAPLANMLEVMKHADGNSDVMQRARDTMERQLAQMVRLIDDLLDVNRISRGKLDLHRERVELASVLYQAVEACRPAVELAEQNLTVTPPRRAVYLYADPVRLAQVFGNLLNNACKYTEPRGHISMTAEQQGGDVAVSVKDTGVGILPDMLPKIFELFTQVDQSLERSQGGLGIGLTLVQRLVEMHGGSVKAFSEGPGRGSEFVVTCPWIVSSSRRLDTSAGRTLGLSTAGLRMVVLSWVLDRGTAGPWI